MLDHFDEMEEHTSPFLSIMVYDNSFHFDCPLDTADQEPEIITPALQECGLTLCEYVPAIAGNPRIPFQHPHPD